MLDDTLKYVGELTPTNGRKSFNGKAKIYKSMDKDIYFLCSYGIYVAAVDKTNKEKSVPIWGGNFSNTTTAHQMSFFKTFADDYEWKNSKDMKKFDGDVIFYILSE